MAKKEEVKKVETKPISKKYVCSSCGFSVNELKDGACRNCGGVLK